MNITIYSDNLDVEILPAYCNWTLIDAIKFDKKNNTFVEPYLPNHEIGIIHFDVLRVGWFRVRNIIPFSL